MADIILRDIGKIYQAIALKFANVFNDSYPERFGRYHGVIWSVDMGNGKEYAIHVYRTKAGNVVVEECNRKGISE